MTTLSSRLGLKKHTDADVFRIEDYADNWNVLDGKPGIHICTSSTRPTWGAGQSGMRIWETDTGLEWNWNGSAWGRISGKGLLGSAERTTDLTNSSAGTYATLVTASVTVPAGNRSVLLIAEGYGVSNTVGLTEIAIYRDATLVQEWSIPAGGGAAANQQPREISLTAVDVPTAGVGVNYLLRFRPVVGFGGTSTVAASANKPTALHVVEV
jgi:hypothetical protein